MSDEDSLICPSTEKQLALAKYIVNELEELGLNPELTSDGYIYAKIPANAPAKNSVGFIAHMDTSPDAPDRDIRPRVVKYAGGDVLLNEEKKIYLSPKDYPLLEKHIGETLVVTDGTTLLGADDKAGVAEIVCAIERIIKENIPHGDISIAFTPDEEIGRGADLFDVEKFGTDYAYTVDGGTLGEIEYENFNAASADVVFNGVSIHPGSAKGKMINASEVAMYFHSLLPERETPYYTENYEGFYHLTGMTGSVERAVMKYIIRDHDREKFEERKRVVERTAEKVRERYGKDSVVCEIKDSYYNMKEKIEPVMYVVDRAKSAFEKNGVRAEFVPIRGGTDGARLSFMGLPCPNLSTGGENFHSRFEYLSVDAFEKMIDVIVTIATDLT